MTSTRKDLLPAEPFRDLLLRDLEKVVNGLEWRKGDERLRFRGLQTLAELAKVNERRLYDVLAERQQYVDPKTVDRYCLETGRHLADVYPHLYPELFEGPCEGCGHQWLALLSEAPRRIHLRCLECGRGAYWDLRPHRGGLPPVPQERIQRAVDLVARGLTQQEAAERMGLISHTTISRYLQMAGVEKRDIRDRSFKPGVRDMATIANQLRAWKNSQRAVWLYSYCGLNFSQAGRELGLTAQGARCAYWRWHDWKGETRTCSRCRQSQVPDLPAALIRKANHLRWCPRCLGEKAVRAS